MKRQLLIYTCTHFLVDLTCIYRLYALVMPQSGNLENWILLVVLYNFLAFALPGLVGLLADYSDVGEGLAAAGCLLTAIPACIPYHVILTVILQGIGNGAFHVGAGRRILQDSHGKYAPSGIFISSGALGVFLGTVWKQHFQTALVIGLPVVLLVCALFLLLAGKKSGKMPLGEKSAVKRNSSAQSGRYICLPVLLLLLVVILRSFYGTAVSYEWKNTFIRSLIFVLCIVAGKALGGIAADLLGVRVAAVLSVGGAAVTVLFSESSIYMGYLSILLFNMTMPLTLTLLYVWWKDSPGFAFGMLMLALFLGTVPDLLGNGIRLSVQGLGFVSLLSFLGLLFVIHRGEQEELL